jgi:hypothetical protein
MHMIQLCKWDCGCFIFGMMCLSQSGPPPNPVMILNTSPTLGHHYYERVLPAGTPLDPSLIDEMKTRLNVVLSIGTLGPPLPSHLWHHTLLLRRVQR